MRMQQDEENYRLHWWSMHFVKSGTQSAFDKYFHHGRRRSLLFWSIFAFTFNVAFFVQLAARHPSSVFEWIPCIYFFLAFTTAVWTLTCLLLKRTTDKIVLLTSLNFAWLSLGMPAFAIGIYCQYRENALKSPALYMWTFILWYGIFLGYVIILHVHYLMFCAGNILFFVSMLITTEFIYKMNCDAIQLESTQMLWSATISILMTAKLVNSCLKTNCLLFKNLQMVEARKEQEMKEKIGNMKRQYIAQTLHDIGTPLTTMTLAQEILEQLNLPEDLDEVLKTFKCALEMMILTRKKALDFVKFEETGILHPTLKPTDLRNILYYKCARIMTGYNNAKDVKLSFTVEDSVPERVMTDGDWIWEMLCNYISNALKFTKRGLVQASISMSSNPRYIVFEVKDTGKGVSDMDKKTLFRPFAQLQDDAGGTGLGLYSVCCKAKALKGSVGVRDNLGVESGAIFYFTIPNAPCEKQRSQDLDSLSLKGLDDLKKEADSHQDSEEEEAQCTKRNSFGMDLHLTTDTEDLNSATFSSNEESVKVPLVTFQDSKKRLKPIDKASISVQSLSSLATQDDLESCIALRGAKTFQHSQTSEDTAITRAPRHSLTEQRQKTLTESVCSRSRRAPSQGGGNCGKKLLLVEDELSIAKFFVHMLTKAGFEVKHVDNGYAALERMKAEEFHAVLCDITMPGIDGYETVKLFREWETQQFSSSRIKSQVIIALSATQIPELKQKAIACGFDSFLSKPVKIKDLISEIDQMTSNRKPP